jgi:3-isopropylmalate/(R)-2-methylmalate dehydratase large subunit
MSTLVEQILSDRADQEVSPGDIVRIPVDFTFGNDLSFPPAIGEFERFDPDAVFDPDRVAITFDHVYPAHNENAAGSHERLEAFAEEYEVTIEREQEHIVLPEKGYIKPGDIVIGADSHSCTPGALGAFATGVGSTDLAFVLAFGWTWIRVPETTRVEFEGTPGAYVEGKDLVLMALSELGVDGAVYHAIEFGGPLVKDLSMAERFTLTNMAIEAGGQTGLIESDETTREYADEHTDGDYHFYKADPDAAVANRVTVDCDGMEPQVAVPPSPANATPVSDVQARDIEIDQAVVGSCTNGRARDIEMAAEILEGNEVDDGVRLIVTPGTRRIEQKSMEEGWSETFIRAGATMTNPGCGACYGDHVGVLGPDEVAVSTTNRNFTGRMGDPTSEVYLASPAVVAASAVAGRIVHPEEVE